MPKVRTKGIAPANFYKQSILDCLNRVNEESLDFEREAIEATPVGVSSYLRNSWNVKLGTLDDPTVIISQTRKYFLPVEAGRKPGKGVSQRGRASLVRWARRKLGLKPKEAKEVALLISLKYYKEGRPATGFLGLVKPGSKAPNKLPDKIKPYPGSILADYFNRIAFRFK